MRDSEFTQNPQGQVVTCCDCGRDFIFTLGERRFYLSKNLTIPPRRCPKCRKIRRATINPDRGHVDFDEVLAKARREIERNG